MSNIAPLFTPLAPWRIWGYDDIYTGPNGTGQYVPKVGDQVNRVIGNVIDSFIVSAVSTGTMLTTLVPVALPTQGVVPPDDHVLGINQSETARIYVDRSVTPYRLAVDVRCLIPGSMTSTCKIFAGTNLQSNPRVVSATYDNAGQYVGENVGLELVASSAYSNNVAIKIIRPCFTMVDLIDGEIVTAVVYDLEGFVVWTKTLRVENTGFIRSMSANQKTVVGLSLLSPFISFNAHVITYPINLHLTEANLTGVVTFSDGTSEAMAIDGGRMSIAGLEAYQASVEGRTYPLVLKYTLGPNEAAYGLNASGNHVSELYTLVTGHPNLSYQIRLFTFPEWISADYGYGLRHFAYDGLRSAAYDITAYVTTTGYAPKAYGQKQTLSLSVNLKYLSPSYGSFIHNQDIDVLLEAPGSFRQNSATPPNWFVTPQHGHLPMYGAGVFATYHNNANNINEIRLSGQWLDVTNWLLNTYYSNTPLLLPGEVTPPLPTHFNLMVGGSQLVYPLTQWHSALSVASTLQNNSTLYIQFIHRTAASDLQLGMVGMPLYAVGASGNYI